MSKKKLSETLRKLDAQMDAKDGVPSEEPVLTMTENPYLTWGALEQMNITGQPEEAGKLRRMLESYNVPQSSGGDPMDYWIRVEEGGDVEDLD
jgi:hypothetical protein